MPCNEDDKKHTQTTSKSPHQLYFDSSLSSDTPEQTPPP